LKLAQTITERISFEFCDERLDVFVGRFFEDISRSKIQSSIENGHVFVNKNIVKKSYMLREDDVVVMDKEKIYEENPKNPSVLPEKIDINVIWEDEHYIVVNKPAGLVVHPGHGQKSGTLLNGLYCYGGEKFMPILVHRLDKDTSGVIIAAKNETAHEKLSEKFANREIYKSYIGISIGKFPNEMSGTMDFPIGRDKKNPIKKAVDYHNGRQSRTDYSILRYQSGIYLTSFRLHSGRTHQIRVHCANRGFPIICDDLYGGEKEKIKFLEQKDRNFALKIYDCFSRQALHARKIVFEHPIEKKEISLTADFPVDFQNAIKILDVTCENI
jgi:23S rRNA pseudouridine1911/1915/1917 synthase